MGELARFRLGFSHEALSSCHMHDHDCVEIVYYSAGSGSVRNGGGRVFPFRRHTVLIHSPWVMHDQMNRQPGIDNCVLIDPAVMNEPPRLNGTLFIDRLASTRLRQEIISLTRLKTVRNPAHQRICDLRATALLLELAALATPAGAIAAGNAGAADTAEAEETEEVALAEGLDPAAARLAQAYRYMQDHFDIIDSVGEIAQKCGLGEDYFRHCFTRRYGQPPRDFLLALRLEHAKRLLRQTPLPQKAIAAQCGFGNIRYFNTRFRHYCGLTPGDYRCGDADTPHAEGTRKE